VDRLSARLYAVVAVAWFLLQEIPASPLTTWLDGVGMKSLAIFVTFDFFQTGVMTVVSRVLGGGAGAAAPAVLTSPAFVPVYFLVGLAGPLLLVAVTEKLLSKRWKRMVWG
jgi:hypothetical protein